VDADDGSPIVVGGATSAIRSISFSPDGRLLEATSEDGTNTLWDLGSRKRLGDTFPIDEGWFGDARFAPDGDVVIEHEWNFGIWPTDLHTWIGFACQVAGRDLTRAEWNDVLPNRPYEHVCTA
jgi:WD40 repeat protein